MRFVPKIVLVCVAAGFAPLSAYPQSVAPVGATGHWEPFPVLPMAWWNDATDVTAGVWLHSGPTSVGTWTLAVARGFGGFQSATIGEAVDFFARVEDPPFLSSRGFRGAADGWALEGTVGARLSVSRPSTESATSMETGGRAEWVATRETGYLDPALWNNAGTVEGVAFHRQRWSRGPLTVAARVEAGGGVAYRFRTGPASGSQYTTTPYGRFWGEGSARRRFGALTLGARGFAGLLLGSDPLPKQRRIGVKGADPYQTLGNPLVRTEGAPFVNGDVFYHSPGHANLRAYRADGAGRWAASVNLEAEMDLLRNEGGVLRRASLVGFWDGGVADTLALQSFSGVGYKVVADAGVGARIWLNLGRIRFPVRVEFPLYVSEPALADNRRQGTDYVEFRWLISLQPIF